MQVVSKHRPDPALRPKARSSRARVVLTSSPVKPIFNIATHADFLAAIEDSQLDQPEYLTYQLQKSLVFDSDHLPYLNDGSSYSDYLYIGPDQTFDGQGFEITFTHGCEPLVNVWSEANTLPGLFTNVYGDDASHLATVQNLTIHILPDMKFIAGIAIYTYFAVLQNIVVFSETTVFEYSYFTFYDAYDTTLDSVAIVSSTPLEATEKIYFVGYTAEGKNIIKNSAFIAPSMGGNYAGGFAYTYNASILEVSNTYLALYDQGAVDNNVVIFDGPDDSNIVYNLTNLYVVLNRYQDVASFAIDFINYSSSGFEANLDSVYTNNSTAVITSGTIVGEVITGFTWAVAPTFATPNGFDAQSPNRLQTFLTFPFNSSSYPLFSSSPLLLQSSTTRPDAVVSTIAGQNGFLYRLINPSANAPTPKVITNEFLHRRNLAPNIVPARNGWAQ